jgi:hypothetical protein
MAGCGVNPKFENRNPKQIRKSKSKTRDFRNSCFGFVSCFEFRISDFGGALRFVVPIVLSFAAVLSVRAEEPSRAAAWFSGGSVRIVSSSHQDTAWMDTPAACRAFRIDHNLLPALEMMRKDPDYTFCMECALHLMELLEAHPELRGEVVQRMKEGRLEFGATYNQPYESWFSGEDLVRETYFGRRWIRKNLPGCDATVAFNPDPPGRSLQMQQILSKAGIPYLFISRYHEGLYRWLSPDGSGVLAYTPGHYVNHSQFLNGAPERCVPAIRRKLDEQATYYEKRGIPPAYCLINSQDFSRPTDFRPLIDVWNARAGNEGAPTMRYSSIHGFFEAIDKPQAKFDTHTGERPDVWVYITGPTHHETDSVKREAARLLPAAETFTVFACLMGSGRDRLPPVQDAAERVPPAVFAGWPAKTFDQAWMDGIYIDHGMGGKNGHITDEIFHRKVLNARDTGRELLDKSLRAIASRVNVPQRAAEGGGAPSPPASDRTVPVIVFNTLSWPRSGPVEVDVPADLADAVHVEDHSGQEVFCQLTSLGAPDEVNVAAASMGASATASSTFGPDYGAEKAIDGRWAVRDPDPELGTSHKWNTAAGAAGPHWLKIDLGRPRTLHKIVVRHEGAMGAFQCETHHNTADFRLQGAGQADGPWVDLVQPVTGNVASLTVHDFAPKALRYVRLEIGRGSQSDNFARIYEVQAFEKKPAVPRLLFVASDVPALGYKAYRLVPGTPRASQLHPLENEFYRLELAPGGIKGLFDKQQNRDLLKTDRFLGGEVFTLLSVAPNDRGAGTDAGEFGAVPMPVMDESFDRVAAHKPSWSLVENGPVRVVYQLEQPLADTTVRQRVVLWHSFRRIDCEADLKDFRGTLWREFRMALPLALEKPALTYEVPMGVVQIGKDEIPTTGGHAYGNLNYWQPCRDIRPRLMQNFVDASDERGGLTLSSSVSAFDWVDPTTNAPSSVVLQPVLLASRKSCNGQGNWYPQAGDHGYRFALTTHEGGWRSGWKQGVSANHPLEAVVGAQPAAGAALPPEMTFCVLAPDHVVVSTIKKCEDDDSVILRCREVEGRDDRATIALFLPATSAERTNLIEEGGEPLSVQEGVVPLKIGHDAIETVRLRMGPKPGEER